MPGNSEPHSSTQRIFNLSRVGHSNLSAFLLALALLVISATGTLPLPAAASIHLGDPNTVSLTNGLVGYWTFDGSVTDWTNGTTADLSGKGNTGYLNGASAKPGKIGQGFFFNGNATTYSVWVPYNSTIAPTQITLSAWIKTASNAPQVLLSRWGVTNSYALVLTSPSNIRLFSTGLLEVTGINYFDNKWHLITGTCDGTTQAIYMDGSLVGSQAGCGMQDGNQDLHIGYESAGFGGEPFSGTIDDVRIYNRALRPGEISQLYHLGQANIGQSNTVAVSNGLVGYWTMDGGDTDWTHGQEQDRSGNGNTGSLIGMSTTTSETAGKIGQALYFNGTTGYIASTNNSGFTDPSKPISVSFWLNAPVSGTVLSTAIDVSPFDGIWLVYGPGFGTGTTQSIIFGEEDTSAHSFRAFSPLGSVPYNKWSHVVVTYDGSGSENGIQIYINGTAASLTRSSFGTPLGTFTNRTWIMGSEQSLDFFATGSYDDLRIYNRALGPGEIAQLYHTGQANVAHSNTIISNGLVGYWTFDGSKTDWRTNTTQDSSGNGNTGTLVAMSTTTSPVPGKIGQALNFDGANTKVNVGTPSSLNLTGAMTISAWIYPTGWGGGSRGRIFDKNNASNAGYQFTLDNSGTTGGLGFGINDINSGNSTFADDSDTSIVSLNKWQHVVAAWDGVSKVTFYVNGVAHGAQNAVNGPAGNSSSVSGLIGARALDSTRNFAGKIDDVRVYNRALGPTEISQLYNAGR
jgi:hypothetical protein